MGLPCPRAAASSSSSSSDASSLEAEDGMHTRWLTKALAMEGDLAETALEAAAASLAAGSRGDTVAATSGTSLPRGVMGASPTLQRKASSTCCSDRSLGCDRALLSTAAEAIVRELKRALVGEKEPSFVLEG
jgi:hypothetical protein